MCERVSSISHHVVPNLFSGKQYIELPYSVKGMDVSFSGILTALKGIVATKLKYISLHRFVLIFVGEENAPKLIYVIHCKKLFLQCWLRLQSEL